MLKNYIPIIPNYVWDICENPAVTRAYDGVNYTLDIMEHPNTIYFRLPKLEDVDMHASEGNEPIVWNQPYIKYGLFDHLIVHAVTILEESHDNTTELYIQILEKFHDMVDIAEKMCCNIVARNSIIGMIAGSIN